MNLKSEKYFHSLQFEEFHQLMEREKSRSFKMRMKISIMKYLYEEIYALHCNFPI